MRRNNPRRFEITHVARWLLEKRYLKKDLHGNVVETVSQLWRRAAGCVSAAELMYGGERARREWESEFYEIISTGHFLPSSPILFNACRDPQMLNACFVLSVGDSLEDILEVTKQAGIIQKAGGGVGFDFSRVRPKGAIVRSTAGVASGPVSFMKGIDAWAQVIKQGGLRRAANMAVLSIHHPDVEEFVQCKIANDQLNAFNLSVGLTDAFMNALCRGDTYGLMDPQTGRPARCSQDVGVNLPMRMAVWRSRPAFSRYDQRGKSDASDWQD